MSLPALARDLLGPGVAVAGGAVADWDLPPWPGETEAVARAVPRRRAEFAAGRAAARAALIALGLAPVALPPRPDGPPLWPPGAHGSITHAGGVVLAAVSREALGLDVEVAADVRGDLARVVLAPGEREPPALDAASGLARAFSAKEAAGKALFALTARRLALREMRLSWDGDAFLALTPDGAASGGQAAWEGMILSAARPGDRLFPPARLAARALPA